MSNVRKTYEQRQFHKYMNLMTVQAASTRPEDLSGLVLDNYNGNYGPTTGLHLVVDKKGRLAYVPAEWLVRRPEAPKEDWEYGVLPVNGDGDIQVYPSAAKVTEIAKGNRFWVAVRRDNNNGLHFWEAF